MEMRKIRIHGPTRTIALPISYLRDLGIQDHEYLAITLESNYIAISKPGAQINNPTADWTPSWRKEKTNERPRAGIPDDIDRPNPPASTPDSDAIQ